MRFAVSGSHATGKSTLIAAFLATRPEYRHEPEAFETLGDDVALGESGEPTPEGLQALLEYTVAAVASRALDARVVFERSPVDYLAYAAASRSAWQGAAVVEFLSAHVPIVKASLRRLELIAYLPVSPDGPEARPGEDDRFRRRVDRCLKRALLEDEYDLLDDRDAPAVVELPPQPERQLAELVRLTEPSEAVHMSGQAEPNVRQAVPFFMVSDMEASVRFYVDGLGFEITHRWVGDDGKLRWCCMRNGEAALMLQEYTREVHGPGRPEGKLGLGVSICFVCRDALAIYREVKARGVAAQTPFVGNAMWVTSLTDPDGYRIDFESPTDVPEETVYSE